MIEYSPRMNTLRDLHGKIIDDLEIAGRQSPYPADANELDARYKSYGVRAAGKKKIFTTHRKAIRAFNQAQQIELATHLIESRYGEQQQIGLWILEPFASYYIPAKFDELDTLIRCLHGWSKVDAFTGSLLRDILFQHPEALTTVVQTWNQAQDMWLRRASVVLFTRKVAKSGKFNNLGLLMCDNLIDDDEVLVQKGVGWALKDMMRSDKVRILTYVQQLKRRGAPKRIISYALKNLPSAERATL